MSPPTKGELHYVINHLILPPKLPQCSDSSSLLDRVLTHIVRDALSSATEILRAENEGSAEAPTWSQLQSMIDLLLKENNAGLLSNQVLDEAIANLATGGVIVLHIHKQNAGLLIRRLPTAYSFECFELSPTTDAVIAAIGRLVRVFPGQSIVVEDVTVLDPSFRNPFIHCVSQLASQVLVDAQETTTKARAQIVETRQTAHPKFVTEMLTGMLRGLGQVQDNAIRFHKRTRDEVLWDNCLEPWRRSPRWMLLRVALQTSFVVKGSTGNLEHSTYKTFMVFLISEVLRQAIKHDFPSELLFTITAKISRRMLKLGSTKMPWLAHVKSTVAAAHSIVKNRWKVILDGPTLIQQYAAFDPANLSESDTWLKLESTKKYFKKASERKLKLVTSSASLPSVHPRIDQDPSTLPSAYFHETYFNEDSKADILLWLVDVEIWVRDHLDTWFQSFKQLPSVSACIALATIITNYRTTAMEQYRDNPERFSFMVLTVMDLWVSLDKCTTLQVPLLCEYTVDFPSEIFDHLLLPKKQDMVRLHTIEKYIESRNANASRKANSIFASPNTSHSFANRYFMQSEEMQSLKVKIESDARAERDQKMLEFTTKKKEHQKKVEDSNAMECEEAFAQRRLTDEPIVVHSPGCEKCRLKGEAERMTITIFEWPLPQNRLEAEAAVFELAMPPIIFHHREATYELLADLLKPYLDVRSIFSDDVFTWHNFASKRNLWKGSVGRVQLASSLKEVSRAHYKEQSISVAEEQSVCVQNGLRLQLYDNKYKLLLANNISSKPTLGKMCILKLPPGRYGTLQYALNSTLHTSNEIMSKQAKCPDNLTLHEFYAFASLRSGHRLQWRNIARELVARCLNLNHHETHLLFAQSVWETGPSVSQNSLFRESHIDLAEEEFGHSILKTVQEVLTSVNSNWQSVMTVRTLILLVTRLFSLSTHKSVHVGCMKILASARLVTLKWTREVVALIQECTVEDHALTQRVLDLALTCYSTFDVERVHLSAMLSSQDNFAALVECAITIHDRRPSSQSTLPVVLQKQLATFYRASILNEKILRQHILEGHGMDDAISRTWISFKRISGTTWSCLPAPNNRWVTTQSEAEGSKTFDVYFNLLTGAVLVNGLPLCRLPANFESHASYRRLFGSKSLEVIPSTMNGMNFQTRGSVHGYQVHFCLHDGELVIRATKNGRTYEFLPPNVLDGDLPSAFVNDYSHWVDDFHCIEFRPHALAWDSSPHNWRTWSHGNHLSLVNGTLKLVDIHTKTAEIIYQILGPIEDRQNVHVFFRYSTSTLEVNLPRFNLDFFIQRNSHRLESKQYRGMYVDDNQSFGSLTGLLNKLVLCSKLDDSQRIVIVPDGLVELEPSQHGHVRVCIRTEESVKVMHHQFQIDSQLGRLLDNGSANSRLFKIYLHALTSYCLPDTLTGRTGTEEAMHQLLQASTQSFPALENADYERLMDIEKLSPRRVYYPRGKKKMQTITWAKNLHFLSQHDSFSPIIEVLIARIESVRPFQGVLSAPFDFKPRGFKELYNRARMRNSAFRTTRFGAEDFNPSLDSLHTSRDAEIGQPEQSVCEIVWLVQDWSTKSPKFPISLKIMESWGHPLKGSGTTVPFGFDTTWLKEPSEIFPEYWFSLHKLFTNMNPPLDKFKCAFLLGTLSYSNYDNEAIINSLLAIAINSNLQSVEIPPHPEFFLEHGYEANRAELSIIIRRHARPSHECPEGKLPKTAGESNKALARRRAQSFLATLDNMIKPIADAILANQRPEDIQISSNNASHFHLENLSSAIRLLARSWQRNQEFKKYVASVQDVIDLPVRSGPTCPVFDGIIAPASLYRPAKSFITFEDMLSNAPINIDAKALLRTSTENLKPLLRLQPKTPAAISSGNGELGALLQRLDGIACGAYEKSYIHDLEESLEAYNDRPLEDKTSNCYAQEILKQNLSQAISIVDDLYSAIHNSLTTSESQEYSISQWTSLQPRLSPSILLSRLSHSRLSQLSPEWRSTIVGYGLALSNLQRARRLIQCEKNNIDLLAELINPGHTNWDPLSHPDWLLFEVENSIMVREDQVQIAQEMIAPSSNHNSIMQLNMGLGKSSVVVPLVSSTLADGQKLIRIVVLRSLSTQMFQLLLSKLGGLLNRQIYYLPISRSLKMNHALALRIQTLFEQCQKSRGILLIEPEHILSLELLGLDRLLSGLEDDTVGKVLTATQSKYKILLTYLLDEQDIYWRQTWKLTRTDWLLKNSRDILDESDEILSVKFELIYTMGSQQSTEYSPHRWIIISRVLDVLAKTALEMVGLEKFKHGLEILRIKPGSFPRIRILQSEAGLELLSRVARKICNNGFPSLPIWSLPSEARDVLLQFLSISAIAEADIQPLLTATSGVQAMEAGLLLLRGLFSGGILLFAFAQKRWRVNYGLDLKRTKLAVPYNAKDSPSARAEFSHPDTAIILTCLSYYYIGLTDDQIHVAFEKLLQSDHAQEEYDRWTEGIQELSDSFRHLNGVNLSNKAQCSEALFPHLRFSKGLIDFYMFELVFPKEMREFTHKLSSSGWEIGRDKAHPTTGFSGTNDSRYALPLQVKQVEMIQQRHTNAAVLDCLLRSENTVDQKYTPEVEVLDAEVLLHMAINSNPKVRVILDVGAQILELRNEEVARKWLTLVASQDASAAIFVDDRNDLCVVGRNGMKEYLSASPFSKQMDQCLVYLDEAHTRGTDLKLPTDYRALVTLCQGLTKDRLAQACMRLRKLGKGQSVEFCASKEVRMKILEGNGKSVDDTVDVMDVLSWCIQNTWHSTRKSIPLWATQGVRHYRRRALCNTSSGIPQNPKAMLESEAQTLRQRYGFDAKSSEERAIFQQGGVDSVEVTAIRLKCQEFGLSSFGDSALHEEQERELQPENEREQEIERPPPLPPMDHSLHPKVAELASNGILDRFSPAFQPAFLTLQETSAGPNFEASAWPQDLLTTLNFSQTVALNKGGSRDQYLRPVHWIISLRGVIGQTFIILSPQEANDVIESVRKSQKVSLHIYTPRLSLSSPNLEDLSFCSVPAMLNTWMTPTLAPQINLFAGQIYIKDMTEYLALCRLLGLSYKAPEKGIRVSCDGFVEPADRSKLDQLMQRDCRFKKSPIAFLTTVMALRRKGQSFADSHLGKILNGDLLHENDFGTKKEVSKK